jgi:hypothetical protein
MSVQDSHLHLGTLLGRNETVVPPTATTNKTNATGRSTSGPPTSRRPGTWPERACVPPHLVGPRPAQSDFSSRSQPAGHAAPAAGGGTSRPPSTIRVVQFQPVLCNRLEFQRKASRELVELAHPEWIDTKRRIDWARKAKLLASCGTTYVRSRCACGHSIGAIICNCRLNICTLCLRHSVHRFIMQIRAMLSYLPRGYREMDLHLMEFYLPYGPTVEKNVSVRGLHQIRAILRRSIAQTWRQFLKFLSVPGGCSGMLVVTGTSTQGHVFARGIFFGRAVDEAKLRAVFARSTNGAQSAKRKQVVPCSHVAEPTAVKEMVSYLTQGNLPDGMDIARGEPGQYVDPKLAARIELAFSGHRAVEAFGAFRTLSDDDDETRFQDAFGCCPRCGALNRRTQIEIPLGELVRDMRTDWSPAFARRFPGKTRRPRPSPTPRPKV